jgi:hypothetical protein
MKLTASPQDGLEIVLENPPDWLMVMAVLYDANVDGFDMAARLGEAMAATGTWEDWSEWVMPDLREGFAENLRTVALAVQTAQGDRFLEPGMVKIPKHELFPWYATLNQARLALETKYRLTVEPPDPDGDPDRWAAHVRSQFYSLLQTQILDLGME